MRDSLDISEVRTQTNQTFGLNSHWRLSQTSEDEAESEDEDDPFMGSFPNVATSPVHQVPEKENSILLIGAYHISNVVFYSK